MTKIEKCQKEILSIMLKIIKPCSLIVGRTRNNRCRIERVRSGRMIFFCIASLLSSGQVEGDRKRGWKNDIGKSIGHFVNCRSSRRRKHGEKMAVVVAAKVNDTIWE